MNYVIGDIHGMYKKLDTLISFVLKSDSNPSFIFVGDYINKGPNPKKVLNYLKTLNSSYNCIFLLGNHELYWIDFKLFKNELRLKGGEKTLKDFGLGNYEKTSKYLKNQFPFIFKEFKLFHITKNYIISHSGINPNKLKAKINNLTKEDFIFNRIEFLKSKNFYLDKYLMIFGHTAFYSTYFDGFKIGIDTGACYDINQPLTSFCLEKNIFIDSNKLEYHLSSIETKQSPIIIRK